MFDTFVQDRDKQITPARIEVAADGDRAVIAGWVKREPAAVRASSDAALFADQALAKWDYYRNRGWCPASWPELKAQIAASPPIELGVLFVVQCKALSADAPLGFAFARRTWANSLAIDFLAAAPETATRGIIVGFGLLIGLLRAAEDLDAPRIWGETTAGSVKFYKGLLRRDLDDIVVLGREEYVALLKRAD